MCALMSVAKMVHRFAHSRITKGKLPAKMSGPRMGVLFAVHRAGGLRMGDLAARIDVTPRTVTDLVDGLERDGLLVRKPDSEDRRATRLELTPRAARDFEKMRSIREGFIGEIFSPLDARELEQLIALMEKLQKGPIGQMRQEIWDDVTKP